MGIASTPKVVCGSETRDSHAKSVQPGNREWVTIIVAMNALGLLYLRKSFWLRKSINPSGIQLFQGIIKSA